MERKLFVSVYLRKNVVVIELIMNHLYIGSDVTIIKLYNLIFFIEIYKKKLFRG